MVVIGLAFGEKIAVEISEPIWVAPLSVDDAIEQLGIWLLMWMSVRLVLLLPVPHIDATDNMANPEKWRRKEQQPNWIKCCESRPSSCLGRRHSRRIRQAEFSNLE
jgi:hypothetical protein